MVREDSSVVREIVEGVTRFARPHRPWAFRRMDPESFNESSMRAWGPDGIIVHAKVAPSMERLGVPIVSVANLADKDHDKCDTVHVNDTEVARVAAEYLCDAGFTSLGFVGIATFAFSRERQRSFEHTVAKRGGTVKTMTLRPRGPWNRRTGLGRHDELLIDKWLQQLPRPLAVFAANDEASLPVNEACQRLGLRIPEDVALLGADNDVLLCELSWPPLSSVMVPTRRVGFEAAALLDKRMEGRGTAKPVHRLLVPVGVHMRQSSDILALDDADLAAAVRFIRDHAEEPISVQDVLRRVPIARRSLERRFRQILGRSPLDEIHHVRVERAKQILSNTDLSMPDVAFRSGLGDNKQLCAVFRRLTGMTPTAWRNRSRVRTG